MGGEKAMAPGPALQSTVSLINAVMRCSNTGWNERSVPYWLCFGALWGIVMNRGVVPDGDLDLCTYYGQDWKFIRHGFESRGYKCSKVLLNDVDRESALYMGFEPHDHSMPHICLSFWYLHDGIRYYCHDQHHEVHGEGVPAHGYSFKGVPDVLVDPGRENWSMVEWPGISGSVKVRVPTSPGGILDALYPAWAYRKQRYNPKDHQVIDEKCTSVYHGGAISRWMVHVDSMRQWDDAKHVGDQLKDGRARWLHAVTALRLG